MKTAEVAIEHVLVGLLALCAFVLPLLSGLNVDQKLLQSEALVGLLLMAYLFGIVFDKLADTVLSPIDQWLRLKQADHHLKENKRCYDGDPFPQDALEFSLRGKQDGRLEWMDSLRSRIRTSRGLAVLGLPAAMGIAIYQSFGRDLSQMSLNWPHALVAFNLVFVFISVTISSSKTFKIRKTYELSESDSERKDDMHEATKHMWIHTSCYVLVLLTSAVTVGIIAASRDKPFESAVIGVCGAVASLLALWTWYHINETYMSFIYQKLPELLGEKDDNLHQGNLA